ncbi:hypothetical protein EXN66_Car006832 [Channa argus]|uniref:Uncharacterized protein n=1 Tax=Channa argus TaxID=215402 RepID=A0A6G1PLQ6_CHAAH|nr:hypothetical protein EXN66_Car006832 [Channa argus]
MKTAQMKNEEIYLLQPVSLFLSFNALFTSFICLFPEAAIFIHTLVPQWLEAG